jgi:hypothetical protein
MDDNELPNKILWTNPGGQRGCGRPKSRWIDEVEKDARKVGCRNWRAMSRIEVAGDICLRRPRPTQSCTTDDDYDDDDDGDNDENPNASRTFMGAVYIIPARLRIM